MSTLTKVAQTLVQVTGPIQVLLGLLIWTGHALGLLQLHMLVGMIFVLALWTLAGIAAWAGLGRARALTAVAWGLIVPLFGMVQTRLLPGAAHWLVRLTHLLIGIAAMLVAARLVRFIRSSPPRGRGLLVEPSAP